MQQTSLEAYQSVQPRLPSLREQVYEVIKEAGDTGLIMEEVADRLPNLPMTSIWQRPAELIREGRVQVIGKRRNSNNRNQNILRAV